MLVFHLQDSISLVCQTLDLIHTCVNQNIIFASHIFLYGLLHFKFRRRETGIMINGGIWQHIM